MKWKKEGLTIQQIPYAYFVNPPDKCILVHTRVHDGSAASYGDIYVEHSSHSKDTHPDWLINGVVQEHVLAVLSKAAHPVQLNRPQDHTHTAETPFVI